MGHRAQGILKNSEFGLRPIGAYAYAPVGSRKKRFRVVGCELRVGGCELRARGITTLLFDVQYRLHFREIDHDTGRYYRQSFGCR